MRSAVQVHLVEVSTTNLVDKQEDKICNCVSENVKGITSD